jgi:starch synthase (maltosyl-transferring)
MLTQSPEPGSRLQSRVGDTLTFVLVTGTTKPGHAWLRTNLGRVARQHAAIIAHVEEGIEPRGDDWHDIPMTVREAGVYSVRIPMLESGSFEAKTLFQEDTAPVPSWPPGPNVYIKITSAQTVAANSMYCAFVRQFGPHQHSEPGLTPERIRSTEILDASGYTVIPRSGTFRNLIRELDTIMGTMRFRILQLLPIFPAPTTYGRMGRFGSPFAVRDLLDVDPALAEFDRNATPFMQFMELVLATHSRKGRLFLDIPINHTGWASILQTHHPEWFVRNPDGSIQSPGAWGVVWEDLCKLDYTRRGLWKHMAEVFLFWCRHGVDGFRCDAGYMVPVPVWQYIVASVRREYPDTTFLLEGLGGKFEVVTELLSTSNLDWAYSELFQNYDQGQVYSYLNSTLRRDA